MRVPPMRVTKSAVSAVITQCRVPEPKLATPATVSTARHLEPRERHHALLSRPNPDSQGGCHTVDTLQSLSSRVSKIWLASTPRIAAMALASIALRALHRNEKQGYVTHV